MKPLPWEMSYEEYLQTDHWQEVRQKYWDNPKTLKECLVCGKKSTLRLHHNNYQCLWHEDIHKDLDPVCYECHHNIHFDGKRRIPLKPAYLSDRIVWLKFRQYGLRVWDIKPSLWFELMGVGLKALWRSYRV